MDTNHNIGMGSQPGVVETPREVVKQLINMENHLEEVRALISVAFERFGFVLSPIGPTGVSEETKMPPVSSMSERLISANDCLVRQIIVPLKSLLERSEV